MKPGLYNQVWSCSKTINRCVCLFCMGLCYIYDTKAEQWWVSGGVKQEKVCPYKQGAPSVHLKVFQNWQSFDGWGRCGAEDAQCHHCEGLPVSAVRVASGPAP